MKKIIKVIILVMIFKSCVESNKTDSSSKVNYQFLDGLNKEELDSFANKLLERNSNDSLKVLYGYCIKNGDKRYYYELAETYFIAKDKIGFELLKKGAFFKQNNCLLALAMFYENGTFNLMKGNFSISPNKDSAIYYYTMAANNGDLQSQYSLGYNYYNQHMKDSSEKYLKMCIENNDLDESDLKGAALTMLNRR